MKARLLCGAVGMMAIAAGCGGGGGHSSTPTNPKDNLLRVEALRSITPETWTELANILPEIENANPNASPEELGKVLLNKIPQIVNPSTRLLIGDIIYNDIAHRLTEAELQLLEQASARRVALTIYATVKALAAARLVFLSERPATFKYAQNKADAFRHSYWNALLCLYVDEQWAEDLATAHETREPPAGKTLEPDRSMDLHNNAVGRHVFRQIGFAGIIPRFLKDALRFYLYKKVADGHINSNDSGDMNFLIYFRGKNDAFIEAFDATDDSSGSDDSDDDSGGGSGDSSGDSGGGSGGDSGGSDGGGSGDGGGSTDPSDTTNPTLSWARVDTLSDGTFKLLAEFADSSSGVDKNRFWIQDPAYNWYQVGDWNFDNPSNLPVDMKGQSPNSNKF